MNVGETPDPTIQTTKRGVTRMTLMSPLNATNSQERKPYIYIYIYMTLDSKKRYKHTTDFTLIAQTELLVILF